MNAFLLLALGSVPPVQSADVVETYAAKHVTAERLIKSLIDVFGLSDPVTQSVKMNLRATYDPATNRVILSGSKDDVKQALEVLSLFDVRPVKMKLSCQWIGKDSEDGGTFEVIVKNNQELVLGGLEDDLDISTRGRLNEDGTITLALKFSGDAMKDKKEVAVVVRVKQGEEAVIGSVLKDADQKKAAYQVGTLPYTFRFKISEQK